MARNKLEFGYSANDNRGDPLREGAMEIEHALAEIYSFLSGGLSEVSLPQAIPPSRGGTGASTDTGVRKFVSNSGLKMFNPVLIKHVPVAYCVVGLGMSPKTVPVTELTQEILFIRLGVGVYKCIVFDFIDINAGMIHIQADNFGNQKYGAVATKVGNEITIKVHPLVFSSTTGLFSVDESTTVDIPDTTYMAFTLVNTLGINYP